MIIKESYMITENCQNSEVLSYMIIKESYMITKESYMITEMPVNPHTSSILLSTLIYPHYLSCRKTPKKGGRRFPPPLAPFPTSKQSLPRGTSAVVPHHLGWGNFVDRFSRPSSPLRKGGRRATRSCRCLPAQQFVTS